jgi:Ca2+-dependent lipid-binding protein
MDPFCVLSFRGHEVKTTVKDNAGKKPVWNEKFTFNIQAITETFKIDVLEEDLAGNDEVGFLQLPFSRICKDKNDEWFGI